MLIKSDLYKFIARAEVGGTQVSKEVYPVFSDFAIVERDEDYHKIISSAGTLTFVDKAKEQITDFSFIRNAELEDITTKIYIDVYTDNQIRFQGYFYPYQCRFDDDNCLAEVGLIADDQYNCVIKGYDEKYNILSEVDAWGLYRINPLITFYTFECEQDLYVDEIYVNGNCVVFSEGPPGSNGLPHSHGSFNPLFPWSYYSQFNVLASACLPDKMTQDGATPYGIQNPYGIQLINAARVISSEYTVLSAGPSYSQIDGNGNTVTVNTWLTRVKTTWGFESVITQNNPINNIAVPPGPIPADGWMAYKEYYLNNLLVTRWVRQPYFNNQTYNYAKTVSECNHSIYELIDPIINDPSNTEHIYRGRNLSDCINMFLSKLDCGLTYESEFLNGTINPVTGTANKLNKLQVNNCSDIKDPDSTEPATILETSFKEMLENLTNYLNCYWYIDNNRFIIEHISYFENGYTYGTNVNPVENLQTYISKSTKQPELLASNKYNYNTNKIFNKEVWTNSQYLNFDFSDLYIKYGLQSDNLELSRGTTYLTDVGGIYATPDSFANNAVVLIAIQEQVVNILTGQVGWVIVNESGVRSGDLVVNGHLCWSNLIPTYWEHGRILIKGVLNDDITTFLSEISKKQQVVSVTDCEYDLHVPDRVKTFLGTGRIVGSNWDIVKKVNTLDIEI